MAMDIKDDMFLVGDIFMRKFYSVFDRDNDRVGLAKSVHGWSNYINVKDIQTQSNTMVKY